jgi:uncharacterized protein (DUF1697 family)
MATHVALLRGINVGKAKRVAMADLRTLVEGLGYGDVRTLLNSGNVVFDVPRAVRGEPAGRIEKAFTKEFGFSSRITVLSAAELNAVVTANPLAKKGRDPTRLLVTVLTDPKDRVRVEPVLGLKWSPEAVVVGERAVYFWVPQGPHGEPGVSGRDEIARRRGHHTQLGHRVEAPVAARTLKLGRDGRFCPGGVSNLPAQREAKPTGVAGRHVVRARLAVSRTIATLGSIQAS